MSKTPKSAIALTSPARKGSRYPAPHNIPCVDRTKHILGDQFGLDQFGVNLAVMPPGVWSSQRHWHENEDEFIYVLEGEITLADDSGEHVLTPGMCAGFKAGVNNGHCLKNLTNKTVKYLEVGSRHPVEKAQYSDIDMMAIIKNNKAQFVKRDGSEF